ncbi:g6874 [Coccomyxa elongata]
MSYRRRADGQVLARHGSLSTRTSQELADLDTARRLQRTKTVLEDSTEAEKTITQILSVVAVLVANVAFLGYVVPPGGPHPYWETCNYSAYISFFYFNGFAFLFSLCAVCVMIFMPWLLQDSANILFYWIG